MNNVLLVLCTSAPKLLSETLKAATADYEDSHQCSNNMSQTGIGVSLRVSPDVSEPSSARDRPLCRRLTPFQRLHALACLLLTHAMYRQSKIILDGYPGLANGIGNRARCGGPSRDSKWCLTFSSWHPQGKGGLLIFDEGILRLAGPV